ncbi:MAG: AraC family ligand binding domain-containing protein [Gemmatimonadota bacterium]|jgi:hypothetical protein
MRSSRAEMETTIDEPGLRIQEAVWDDTHVSFETFREPFDATPLHVGLPDDRCQCPHWGYVLKGQARIVYADREEILRAGDAYYLPPGHHVIYEAGTETVEFSPNGPFQETMEVAVRNLEALSD